MTKRPSWLNSIAISRRKAWRLSRWTSKRPNSERILPVSTRLSRSTASSTPISWRGEPSELQAKIPQAENLNAWPTTFFLGRDGKVHAIHAGFAAKASGEYNAELKRDVTGTVERAALGKRGRFPLDVHSAGRLEQAV